MFPPNVLGMVLVVLIKHAQIILEQLIIKNAIIGYLHAQLIIPIQPVSLCLNNVKIKHKKIAQLHSKLNAIIKIIFVLILILTHYVQLLNYPHLMMIIYRSASRFLS